MEEDQIIQQKNWSKIYTESFCLLIASAEQLVNKPEFENISKTIKAKLTENNNTKYYNVIISNFKAQSRELSNCPRKFFCEIILDDVVLNSFAKLFGKEYLDQINENEKRRQYAVEMNTYLTNKRNTAKKYLIEGNNMLEFENYFKELNKQFKKVVKKSALKNNSDKNVKNIGNNKITNSTINFNINSANTFGNVILNSTSKTSKTPYFIILNNSKIGLLHCSSTNVYYNFEKYFEQHKSVLDFFDFEQGEEGERTYNLKNFLNDKVQKDLSFNINNF